MSPSLEDRLKVWRDTKFKSEGERRIAEFLNQRRIRYVYEQGLLVSDQGKPKIWHPDFYLPEFAVYIEYYGLAGNSDYDKGIEKKNRVYTGMGLEVIPIYPWTFKNDWQGYLLHRLCEISKRRIDTLAEKLPQESPSSVNFRTSERVASYLDPADYLKMPY